MVVDFISDIFTDFQLIGVSVEKMANLVFTIAKLRILVGNFRKTQTVLDFYVGDMGTF